VVGDSILIVSGSVAGSVAVDTVHVVRAYPQALSIVPDSFSISDTLGRRTITATALRVPGFVTRGTRVFFAARSSDSLLNGHAVGTFDSPALTDSLGNVTVHYTLNGDGGLHRDSVTVFATVFGPTANDSVTGRVTLTISPKFAPDIVLSRDTSTFHAAFGGVVTPAVDSIFITNGGTGALSGLSLSTPIYSAGGSGWLKTSLVISTANPALLTMVANSGGLSPGIYTASVLVTSTAPGAINNPATLTVTLTIM
jgi:hypothetical protein